jgi:hypothetical protein
MLDLIAWLQGTGVTDVINASMTVVLASFAAVQLLQLRRARREHLRTAYGAMWVEYWRVWTVSESWRKDDLEGRSRLGLFSPSQIRPSDWGNILPLLGRLGMQPARFVGMAYAFVDNAARSGEYLIRLVQERNELVDAAKSAEDVQDVFARFKDPVAEAVERTRVLAHMAADSFEDGLKSAPKWLHKETIDLSGLKSELAERLGARFSKGIER